MLTRIGDMRSREVISVRDGARLGYLGDIEIDTESASLAAIVVYGRAPVFSACSATRPTASSRGATSRTIGEDAVLVDYAAPKRTQKRGFPREFL